MKNELILKALLKKGKTTIEDLKSYFKINDEELVELLLGFLEQEMAKFDFYKENKSCFPKYAFIANKLIEDVYDNMSNDGKNKFPYLKKQRTILKKMAYLSRKYQYTDYERLTVPELLYLDIYYYHDLKKLTSDLEKSALFINGDIDNTKLINLVLKDYIDNLLNFTNDEYTYMKKVVKKLIDFSYKYGNTITSIDNFYLENKNNMLAKTFDASNLYRRNDFFNIFNEFYKKIDKNENVVLTFSNEVIDYTNEKVFTVDPANTFSKDDAVSIKTNEDNIEVNLYVTDIADVVARAPYLDFTAYNAWFSDELHLFSDDLIRKELSLLPGVERRVKVYKFTFDKKMNLRKFDIGNGKIKVSKSYTYDEVEKILNSPTLSRKNPKFKKLYALTKKLEKENNFKDKYHTLKELLDYINNDYKNKYNEFKDIHTIISELKIMANYYQATICYENNLPTMYRVNDTNDIEGILDVLKEYCNDYQKDKDIKKLAKLINIESRYSTTNIGHAGLNLKCYGKYTTPIRDYFALLNQISFNDIVLNNNCQNIEKYRFNYEEMEKLQERKIQKRLKESERKRRYSDAVKLTNLENEIIKLLSKEKLTIREISKKLCCSMEMTTNIVKKLTNNLYLVRENKSYYCPIKYDVDRGKLMVTDNGYGIVYFENGDTVVIPKRHVYGFLSGSTVLVKKKIDKNDKVYGKILKGINCAKKTNNKDIADEVTDDKTQIDEVNSDISFNEINRDEYDAINGIGNKAEVEEDVSSILKKHKIRQKFPLAVMEEIKSIPSYVSEEDIVGRVDLRDLLVYTIDGADAKDFDDAISCEVLENGNYLLGIHIADVSHYVKEGTALDLEARKRATSIYVADRVIPMLPEELSNGICSLRPDEDRLAVTTLIEMTPTGEIVDKKIFESVIRSKKRMKYHEVNKILSGIEVEGYNDELIKSLNNSYQLSKIIRQSRENNGCIDFDIPVPKIIVDENGKAIDSVVITRGAGEKEIEDLMILNNNVIGNLFTENKYPAPYRVHDTVDDYKLSQAIDVANIIGVDLDINLLSESIPSKEIANAINSIKDNPNYDIIRGLILRSMAKAHYSVNNIHHYALALDNYTHFTSPIRRYPDLLAHRIWKKQKANEYNIEMALDLEDILDHASLMERTAEACEREIDQFKTIELFSEKIGMESTARIASIDKGGIGIILPNYVRGYIQRKQLGKYEYDGNNLLYRHRNGKEELKLGQEIGVVLTAVDKTNRSLIFANKELEKEKTYIKK